jgi:hypothetical protein
MLSENQNLPLFIDGEKFDGLLDFKLTNRPVWTRMSGGV